MDEFLHDIKKVDHIEVCLSHIGDSGIISKLESCMFMSQRCQVMTQLSKSHI